MVTAADEHARQAEDGAGEAAEDIDRRLRQTPDRHGDFVGDHRECSHAIRQRSRLDEEATLNTARLGPPSLESEGRANIGGQTSARSLAAADEGSRDEHDDSEHEPDDSCQSGHVTRMLDTTADVKGP